MAFLDAWDTRLGGFDNTDDYPMEKLRIEAARRQWGMSRVRFTRGDYAVKVLLGSVMDKYWKMDQPPGQYRRPGWGPGAPLWSDNRLGPGGGGSGGCCTLS
jgi:hypothetical protein